METALTVTEYQQQAHTTACYGGNWYYPVLGLCEEAGEFQGKIAKFIRKHDGEDLIVSSERDDESNMKTTVTEDRKQLEIDSAECEENLQKELGDVCWMVAEICSAFGWQMEEVMRKNLAKLADRQKRGVIVGEGDNR